MTLQCGISLDPRSRMLMGQGTVRATTAFVTERSQTIEYVGGRECANRKAGDCRTCRNAALRGWQCVKERDDEDVVHSELPGSPGLMPRMCGDAASVTRQVRQPKALVHVCRTPG